MNALTPDNWTPLMVAIKENNIDAVTILLKDFKANPNAPVRPFKASPMSIAVERGNIRAVMLLIEYGAERAVPSPYYETDDDESEYYCSDRDEENDSVNSERKIAHHEEHLEYELDNIIDQE